MCCLQIPFPTEAPVHDPEDDQDQWYVGKVGDAKNFL